MLKNSIRPSFFARYATWTLCTAALATPALGQEFKLLPSDGAAEDLFGWSVAIDNGVIAVGSRWDDDNGSRSGSAYLFDAATGSQLAKLVASDGAADDEFGYSIAIDNGIVAVGAYGDDDNGSYSGSAYVFDAATGTQIAKLLPSDGAGGDFFGWSIAIDNGVVAVGARMDDDNGTDSGSAYLFDAATGSQLAKLVASDGAADDEFGYSIAIDSGVVAIGAKLDGDNGFFSGSAYLFDAATGSQIAKLLPTDGATTDFFGCSIAIDNGVVAVGAWSNDDYGSSSGSAYLFDVATGSQIAKLLPSDGAAEDIFGDTIAIDNGIVAVGAWKNDDNGTDSGSAYLFDAATGSQLAKILPADGAAYDSFGFSIAIDNGVVAVGAHADHNENGTDSGSAYLFDAALDFDGDGLFDIYELLLGTDPNDKDTDGDGLTDGLEVNTLGTDPILVDSDADGVIDPLDKCLGGDDTLDADGDGIPDACDTAPACPADMNGDGILDNGDIITFVSLFLAGC